MDYEYIIDEKDRYFVPRPPGICVGIARNKEFKKHLNIEPLIVNPKVWSWLSEKYGIKILQV